MDSPTRPDLNVCPSCQGSKSAFQNVCEACWKILTEKFDGEIPRFPGPAALIAAAKSARDACVPGRWTARAVRAVSFRNSGEMLAALQRFESWAQVEGFPEGFQLRSEGAGPHTRATLSVETHPQHGLRAVVTLA